MKSIHLKSTDQFEKQYGDHRRQSQQSQTCQYCWCLPEHFDISFTLRQRQGFRIANVKLMSKCSGKHQEYWSTSIKEWFLIFWHLLYVLYYFYSNLHSHFSLVKKIVTAIETIDNAQHIADEITRLVLAFQGWSTTVRTSMAAPLFFREG